jgi:hypothetical protein
MSSEKSAHSSIGLAECSSPQKKPHLSHPLREITITVDKASEITEIKSGFGKSGTMVSNSENLFLDLPKKKDTGGGGN